MVLERRTAMKVPQLTVYFWVIKVLTTGMGETTSDYFVHRLGSAPAVALGGIVFAVALTLSSRCRDTGWFYWTAVVMVSVFGTMAADVTISTLAFLTSFRRCVRSR